MLPCFLPSRWYPRTLHLCIGWVTLYSIFVGFRDVCFSLLSLLIPGIIFAALSLPSLRSLVSPLPHQLDKEMVVWFFELCVAALFISFLFFSFLLFSFSCLPSVLPCRPSVGPSPRHIVGLIGPANSSPVPSGLGLHAAQTHQVFCFVFLYFPVFVLPFFAPSYPSLYNSRFYSSFSGVRMYHGNIPLLS